MEFVNDDGDNTCPLCMEEMDLTDRQLKPCKCGYEICVWCWHHVMEVAEKDSTEGRCPACRTPYDKEKIVGMTVNCERLTDASFEKRQKSQKSKSKASEMRKHLSNVRVIQRNLVYIIGIPSHLADEETLERREFFGQYGKVLKVSISRSNASNQHSSSNPTSSVYITYTKEDEAIRCIQAVNGYVLDGRPLRACFGTTKYCHAWLKNMPCNNPDCLYLHDIGTQEDSFTKEEMVSTCASKIPQFHGPTNPSQRRGGSYLPPPEPEVSSANSASSSKLSVKTAAANVGGQTRTSIVNGTTGKLTALPAAASWGLRAAQGKTLPQKTPVIPVSSKHKSSSSHTLSVSPPSNLPTSAAVVVAAAAPSTPVLHSDQCKPSLAVVGNHGSQASQRLPSFASSRQNVRNPQTRTNSTNSMGADSSVISTISDKHMRQVSPEKNPSEGNPEQKQGVYEEIERTSPNTLPKSALPGKPHVEECIETEKIDNLYVSSGFADKRLCHEGLQTVLCNHDDISTSLLQENSSFHSAVHSSKPPLDEPEFSPNLSERENMSCLETSMVETTEGASIAKAEKLCNSNDPEEELSASVVQMLSETGRTKHEFAFDGNNRSFNTRVSSSTVEVCSPHHVSMPKDDLSRGSPVGTPNMVVLDSSDCKTGMADDGTEVSSCSRMDDSLCPMPLSQECGMVKEEGFLRECALVTEQTSEGQFKSAKSQSLDGHQNEKLLNKDSNDTIAGENSIISDILSMDFEILPEDSLASPHNLAKVLLGEKDRTIGFSKDISSSRKFQSSGQSRFSFAREEESSRELSHFSNSLRTNGQLLKIKEALDDRNGYDRLNRLKNDTNACDRDEYQILTNKNTSPNPGSAVVPLPVSRSQFSAPPGFSIPTRTLPVPPPGFPQPRVDRPYESSTSVFANGTKDHDESLSLQNTVPNTYGLVHQTLGSNGCGDVELIDPAIMAVGRGKIPVGQSQHGSAGLPRQDLSNLSYSQSFLGLRTPFSQQQQLSPIDYDARLQMLKQKSMYTNASLTSPRQPLKFQDAVGEAFTSYLSRQNDTMIQSMMIEQSPMNVDPTFSQLSFQQPSISTFRNSSVCANGWDNWNRISSTLEPGLGERRLEATLTDYANKERMLDPRSGLSKIFPSYGDSMFHMSSAENYYSRPFEM